ncbi:hypothetical protein HOLleu_33623 [Holothuria leucospilota]|uniref:Uncharacterized protein n=1 Tax=Holothuria leucospilota TaxID=206669 RepID=A0A9Q0YNZ9_HOLLE|nr:hypothetical protein HOLleu_33623 [Holothuria leucospilota]
MNFERQRKASLCEAKALVPGCLNSSEDEGDVGYSMMVKAVLVFVVPPTRHDYTVG